MDHNINCNPVLERIFLKITRLKRYLRENVFLTMIISFTKSMMMNDGNKKESKFELFN